MARVHSMWERARTFVETGVWDLDVAPLAPGARRGVRVLRLLLAVGDELRGGDLALRATGLVYSTLLSLVPFLAVTFSVLKAFGAHQQLVPSLAAALQPLGPEGAEQVARQIVGFVDNLRVGVLGAVGVAGLFYTVISLIGKVEEALNHAWHVRGGRGFGRKFADYLSVVLVGPVLIFTSLAVMASVQSTSLMDWLAGQGQLGGWLVSLAGRLLPLIFLAVAFTFLYRFLPYTEVRLGPAVTGGLTAAVLWQLAGVAFTSFVAGSPRYAAVYSGFAIIVLFLIWLDVGWLIVLVGGEVAYFTQHPPSHGTRAARLAPPAPVRGRAALTMLAKVTRRHLQGKPPAPLDQLATEVGIPVATLDDLATELARTAILVRTTEPTGLALGRAPETVPLADVLDIVEGVESPDGHPDSSGRPEGDDPVERALALRRLGAREALDTLTLRSLCDPVTPAGERPTRAAG